MKKIIFSLLTISLFSFVAFSQNYASCCGLMEADSTYLGDSIFAIGVPNVFTPNGDGLDDYLIVCKHGTAYQSFSFMVSKNGYSVFESNDIYLGWDGTCYGHIANDGLFDISITIVSISGASLHLTGKICKWRHCVVFTDTSQCVFDAMWDGNGFNFPSIENFVNCDTTNINLFCHGICIDINPAGNCIDAINNITAYSGNILKNYPNPFSRFTTISYSLEKAGVVSIKIFDLKGKELLYLKDNEMQQKGDYQIQLDAKKLDNGVYLIRLITKDEVQTSKMVLIK